MASTALITPLWCWKSIKKTSVVKDVNCEYDSNIYRKYRLCRVPSKFRLVTLASTTEWKKSLPPVYCLINISDNFPPVFRLVDVTILIPRVLSQIFEWNNLWPLTSISLCSISNVRVQKLTDSGYVPVNFQIRPAKRQKEDLTRTAGRTKRTHGLPPQGSAGVTEDQWQKSEFFTRL